MAIPHGRPRLASARVSSFSLSVLIAAIFAIHWLSARADDDEKYNLINLGLPNANATFPEPTESFAMGLNNLGYVVGGFKSGEGTYPFEWRNGRMVPLLNSRGVANGINNKNIVVGSVVTSTGMFPATFDPIWNLSFSKFQIPRWEGTANSINDLGQFSISTFRDADLEFATTAARLLIADNLVTEEAGFAVKTGYDTIVQLFGINQNGFMTGSFGIPSGEFYIARAVRVKPGYSLSGDLRTLRHDYLDHPKNEEGTESVGVGINSFGAIVGRIGSLPYLWENNRPKLLESLGGSFAEAHGINDRSEIVGTSELLPHSTFTHGFVGRKAPNSVDLNTVLNRPMGLSYLLSDGWVVTEAQAINGNGEIVGIGLSPNQEKRGVLLTPANTVVFSYGVKWPGTLNHSGLRGDLNANRFYKSMKENIRSLDPDRSKVKGLDGQSMPGENFKTVYDEFSEMSSDSHLRRDDTLIVYLNSHGGVSNAGIPYLQLTEIPQGLEATALLSEPVLHLLLKAVRPSVQKIVFLDGCRSGDFIKRLCDGTILNIAVIASAPAGGLSHSISLSGYTIEMGAVLSGLDSDENGRHNADIANKGFVTLADLARYAKLDPTQSKYIGKEVRFNELLEGTEIYEGPSTVYGMSPDFVDGINLHPARPSLPPFATLYGENFDSLTVGSLATVTGSPSQNYYVYGGTPGSVAAIQSIVSRFTNHLLGQQCPMTFHEGENSLARRELPATSLSSNSVVMLKFEFLASSSNLSFSNRFDAALRLADESGLDAIRIAISSDGVKSASALNLAIKYWNSDQGNTLVPLTTGTNLDWNAWHSVGMVVDFASRRYVSIVVDGNWQDLSDFPLPRQGSGPAQFLNFIEHDLVAHPVAGQSSDDTILWDNLSVEIGAGMVPSPMAAINHIPPVISTGPEDTVVAEGGNADFTISASGVYPINYQWYRNGDPVAGATNSFLQLTNVLSDAAGDYSVVVSNQFGASTSAIPAKLSVSGGKTAYSSWPMRQRDGANTGRSDFAPSESRLNSNFFGTVLWQKPAPGSPVDGRAGASGMIYYDGVGPEGRDLLVGSYHWPKGIQGMDRHTGRLFWQGNPDGGEAIADNTPAFSRDGKTIYVINDSTPHPLMAFDSRIGPSIYWHNGADSEPMHLGAGAPKVSADGRVFASDWSRPYAGVDTTTNIITTWSSDAAVCNYFSDPALFESGGKLLVVGAGECGQLRGFDGVTGQTIWSVNTDNGTDATPTIDPVSGNIYLALGTDSIAVAGISSDGVPLWNSVALPVYQHQPGLNNPQFASSAGCLAHDGKTFYFQTASQQDDGRLYAIDTANGAVKWSFATRSSGWQGNAASPIVTPNGVIVIGNNAGGAYFAIRDNGTNGNLLASLNLADGGEARATPALSPDGLLYLPARLRWSVSNGDAETPTGVEENLFTAFDLNAAPPTPPSFVVSPKSQTVIPGQKVLFSAIVRGTEPIYYRWEHNGTNLLGENQPTLAIVADALGNAAGNYRLFVSSPAGSLPAQDASLTINYPPGVLSLSTNLTVPVGTNLTLRASAVGSNPLSYQWTLNGTNLLDGLKISGVHSNALTINSVSFSEAGAYGLRVTNLFGVASSEIARVTVTLPGDGTPFFFLQPTNLAVAVGRVAILSGEAASLTPIQYHWQFNGSNLVDQGSVAGSQSNILVIANATTLNDGEYRLIAANAIGSSTSLVARLSTRKILFSVTDLGTLPAPFDGGSLAYGINDLGEVVGKSFVAGNTFHSRAFKYSDGRIIDLGSLPPPYDYASEARALNDKGEVVGHAYSSDFASRGFLFSNGQLHALDLLPAPYNSDSEAWDIANDSTVVGGAFDLAYNQRAYSISGGSISDLGKLLPPPYSARNNARRINSRGEIVLNAYDTKSNARSFLVQNGLAQDLGVLPEPFNIGFLAQDLNNFGQVAGNANDSSHHTRAAFGSRAALVNLGTLPSPFDSSSFANSLNDVGDVVGAAADTNSNLHAFIYQNGQMRDLNELIDPASPYTIFTATSINEHGQIAASSETSDGKTRALLLSPISGPVLKSIQFTNGMLSSSLGGLTPGNVVILQVSSDLAVWKPVWTQVADSDTLPISLPVSDTTNQFYTVTIY